MTGYGVAFPKGSMWIPKFNEYLMKYRENGDLVRTQTKEKTERQKYRKKERKNDRRQRDREAKDRETETER